MHTVRASASVQRDVMPASWSLAPTGVPSAFLWADSNPAPTFPQAIRSLAAERRVRIASLLLPSCGCQPKSACSRLPDAWFACSCHVMFPQRPAPLCLRRRPFHHHLDPQEAPHCADHSTATLPAVPAPAAEQDCRHFSPRHANKRPRAFFSLPAQDRQVEALASVELIKQACDRRLRRPPPSLRVSGPVLLKEQVLRTLAEEGVRIEVHLGAEADGALSCHGDSSTRTLPRCIPGFSGNRNVRYPARVRRSVAGARPWRAGVRGHFPRHRLCAGARQPDHLPRLPLCERVRSGHLRVFESLLFLMRQGGQSSPASAHSKPSALGSLSAAAARSVIAAGTRRSCRGMQPPLETPPNKATRLAARQAAPAPLAAAPQPPAPPPAAPAPFGNRRRPPARPAPALQPRRPHQRTRALAASSPAPCITPSGWRPSSTSSPGACRTSLRSWCGGRALSLVCSEACVPNSPPCSSP